MKRLWIAAAIILTLAALAGVNVLVLDHFTGELDELLSQAEEQAAGESWQRAESLTRDALERWEKHDFYLHTTLRHDDTDAILRSFHEVLAFLEADEKQTAEYAAANSRLRVQIALLLEAELPSLKNVL